MHFTLREGIYDSKSTFLYGSKCIRWDIWRLIVILHRIELLKVWKGIAGVDATYENLIKACIKGEHADAVENICKYMQESIKGIISYIHYNEQVSNHHLATKRCMHGSKSIA